MSLDRLADLTRPDTISIQTTLEVPRERIADTLCCALEGGSSFWVEKFQPARYPEGCEWGHEAVAAGASFSIVFDGGEELDIQVNDMLWKNTLQLMATEFPKHFGDMMGEVEDAQTGDILFQLLCFGEMVYG